MPKEKTAPPPGLAMMNELPLGLTMQIGEKGSLPPGLAMRFEGHPDIDVFVANIAGSDQVLLNEGNAEFVPASLQPPGFSSTDNIALGDLDGDGDLDAFLAKPGLNEVLLNDGNANFTAAFPQPESFSGNSVALGDLDGDGDLDAFVATGANQGNQVLLNDGNAVFSPAASMPPGNDISNDVALGDLDGDGDLDAFVVNMTSKNVFLNDGDGNFVLAPSQPPGLQTSRAVALADLDGDGDLDAFAADASGLGEQSSLEVFFNDGSGFFFLAPTQPSGIQTNEDIALGDLDGDGDFDAFVTGQSNRVLLNDGTGVFIDAEAQPPSPAGTSTNDVALADLDGDGDLDAFVTTDIQWLNQVLLNDGTGSFSEVLSPPAGNQMSQGVALGDLDGDGDVPPVNEYGLPNINPDGLLPSMYVDMII